MLPPHEIANRMRAARALADITVEELAGRLGPGLSAKTLGNMEREERVARTQDLRAIAAACELPYEFFTVDFNAALDGGDPRLRDLVESADERIRELVDAVQALTGDIVRHNREIQELRDMGRRQRPAGGAQ